MNLDKRLTRRAQRGFSIIEALIAGLVLSFGTLALVGVQVALSRNGDVAKQRSEATRLAQEQMENLRSYASATTTVTGVSSYESLATGSDATTTIRNTAFDRSWTVGGAGTDLHRPVSVLVAWIDRAGAAQEVRLSSVIAKTNYNKVGLIMANVGGSGYAGIVRQRNNNVPYPAVDIGNDKSRYQWPGQSVWYVFDNTTANVEYRCTSAPTNGATLSTTAGCTNILAYVLAGYVSSNTSNGANDNIDTVLSPWSINLCAFTSTANLQSTPSCFVENVVVSSAINSNCPYLVSNIAPTSAQLDGLKFYKCYAALIEVPLGDTTGWTGRLEFAAAPTGNRKVCRFNHLLVDASGIYRNIEESLNNENYFARLSGNCGSGQTQHQP
jgi:type II secretory pathway pseudopilin PulG